MKNKKQTSSNSYTARVVIYGLDNGPAYMLYVAKWLSQLSKDIVKNAKKENRRLNTKQPTYNGVFVARLMK